MPVITIAEWGEEPDLTGKGCTVCGRIGVVQVIRAFPEELSGSEAA